MKMAHKQVYQTPKTQSTIFFAKQVPLQTQLTLYYNVSNVN